MVRITVTEGKIDDDVRAYRGLPYQCGDLENGLMGSVAQIQPKMGREARKAQRMMRTLQSAYFACDHQETRLGTCNGS